VSKKKLCGCPRARFEQFDPDDEEEAVDVRVTVLRAVMRRQEKRRVVGVTAAAHSLSGVAAVSEKRRVGGRDHTLSWCGFHVRTEREGWWVPRPLPHAVLVRWPCAYINLPCSCGSLRACAPQPTTKLDFGAPSDTADSCPLVEPG
jgi:hypothetical protein